MKQINFYVAPCGSVLIDPSLEGVECKRSGADDAHGVVTPGYIRFDEGTDTACVTLETLNLLAHVHNSFYTAGEIRVAFGNVMCLRITEVRSWKPKS